MRTGNHCFDWGGGELSALEFLFVAPDIAQVFLTTNSSTDGVVRKPIISLLLRWNWRAISLYIEFFPADFNVPRNVRQDGFRTESIKYFIFSELLGVKIPSGMCSVYRRVVNNEIEFSRYIAVKEWEINLFFLLHVYYFFVLKLG